MSCFLYSHSEREHKSHWKVPVPATCGPHFRLHGVTHSFSEVSASVRTGDGQTGGGVGGGGCLQDSVIGGGQIYFLCLEE